MEPVTADSGYAMYARTVQACVFKVLMDALSGLLVDATVRFSSEGIKIVELDNTHIVMLHLTLDARKFEEFYCEAPLDLGINISNLHTLLKTVNTSDTLTLFLEKSDRNRLGIRVENEEKRTRTQFRLSLLDLDVNEYNIPPVGFSSCVILPATYFQKILRDMSNLSENVEIKSINRQLVLSCSGNFCSQETVLHDTDRGEGEDDEGDDADASLIKQGVFSIKYLCMFCKCSSLCSNVEIFIKNSFPLVLRYKIGLGSLKLALSPRENDIEY